MSFIARPGLLRCGLAAPLRTAPRAVASRIPALRRGVQTNPISEKQQYELLNQQRMNRPNSPHLEIYQPQLTWYLSGLHRITGVALGGLFYVGALAYCLHPLYPAIDSTHLINLVHDLPTWVKVTGKTLIAFPLSFHSFNGLRHLMWDTGKGE
ncbi:hypothetical protein A1Q2_05054 [Trichosporon asahii var. asahii CBS 8904]|uniref:Succinate dehydrogenase, cytochrome b556 subunit n=1 Tax=Trichosporon asahii var. asahii (strain CBS 8904) TaxID=1220162 RepID=K1WGV5_TRIAC|nr:hypothetical protein A1Q2_05054 [Trichosporon asahii var. asahii CBS 8904]